jgi:hypothetical protein
MQLLYHDTNTKAGERTAHFVAFDKDAKRVVVGVKGTSSINDVITDCVCAAVRSSVLLSAVILAGFISFFLRRCLGGRRSLS